VEVRFEGKGTATVGDIMDALAGIPREQEMYISIDNKESHINFIESENGVTWIGVS
jgi:hypothetical protein